MSKEASENINEDSTFSSYGLTLHTVKGVNKISIMLQIRKPIFSVLLQIPA